MIGTVMQDDQLFAGSIADNISFFDPSADPAWIEQCARIAAVHSEIVAMPMGYHTLIGDMGASISGGQKQRILLARALYKRPKILFLDEATSALDVEREREVNNAIRQLDLTRVIVAHRPETIASASRVIVLNDGKVSQDLRSGAVRRRKHPRRLGRACRPKLAGMNILGIESSCDETGVALVRSTGSETPRLLAHALHSQIDMHQAYGGVVPELASRDHIRRVLPLARQVLGEAALSLADVDCVAYTRGPGLAGALLVGAGVACSLAAALGRPVRRRASPRRAFAVAVLVSRCAVVPLRRAACLRRPHAADACGDVGQYELLGEDDRRRGRRSVRQVRRSCSASATPVGRRSQRLAEFGNPAAFELPRPLLHSGDLDFSFAGLKTAVRTQAMKLGTQRLRTGSEPIWRPRPSRPSSTCWSRRR
jgi:energy-coupling factor transporter ATP-binding protein EcfA2